MGVAGPASGLAGAMAKHGQLSPMSNDWGVRCRMSRGRIRQINTSHAPLALGCENVSRAHSASRLA
jgi:hypothetical protein